MMPLPAKIILLLSLLAPSAAFLPSRFSRAVRSRSRKTKTAAHTELTDRLLEAKGASGKSFNEIADELGLMNAYVCQLFLGQAQLKDGATAEALQAAVPGISDGDLQAMKECPFRGFDSKILKEPNVYRTYEAITHYGEAIKMLINEECGDGIMSAIDYYLDVGTTVGAQGERRVVITMNGKFLPHIEQRADQNTLGKGPRE
mmetsp:Transcript_17285/g.31743  ORF Transcript_17285/g.31743 Transcript_17285/m.31743 type:complete len:202 (-) Transcript_17285:207-812(-)